MFQNIFLSFSNGLVQTSSRRRTWIHELIRDHSINMSVRNNAAPPSYKSDHEASKALLESDSETETGIIDSTSGVPGAGWPKRGPSFRVMLAFALFNTAALTAIYLALAGPRASTSRPESPADRVFPPREVHVWAPSRC